MNKYLQRFVMLALCFASTIMAMAYDFNVDGICYNITDVQKKEVEVTSNHHLEYKGNIKIPSTVQYENITYSVTSIGSIAFCGCPSLTSVTIPNSVKNIGYGSFWECSGLTSVTIPESVSSIGNIAFRDCSNLKTITIPNSVTTIGLGAFEGCDKLQDENGICYSGNWVIWRKKDVVTANIKDGITSFANGVFRGCSSLTFVAIPNSMTSIQDYVFEDCISLSSVTIGNSVTSIGREAFQGCSNLTSLTIPKSVTSIGIFAFGGCSNLTSMTIPESVTSVGEGVFRGCSSLAVITVDCENTIYDSRDNCNAVIETETNTLIATCKNTIIPNSVTSVGAEAFYYCSGLTSLTIPDFVTSIGKYAFQGCSDLVSVTIGNSVTNIGDGAFDGCRRLTSVTIPESVTSIGELVFQNCSGLTSLTIPDYVTNIGKYAFSGCSGLISVIIPNSITKIEKETFRGCKNLKRVVLGTGIRYIALDVFDGCTQLDEMIVNATKVPVTEGNPFISTNYRNGSLFVPKEAVATYSAAFPWYGWSNILSLEEVPWVEKCGTPTISFNHMKLSFCSETTGAQFHYTLMPVGANGENTTDGTIDIQDLIVSVYATADGMAKSDTATMQIKYIHDEILYVYDDSRSAIKLPSGDVIMLTIKDGVIHIEDAPTESTIYVYSLTGEMVEMRKVYEKDTELRLPRNATYIIKTCDKTFKVKI